MGGGSFSFALTHGCRRGSMCMDGTREGISFVWSRAKAGGRVRNTLTVLHDFFCTAIPHMGKIPQMGSGFRIIPQ